MAGEYSTVSRSYHVGESCAFADGPGVWPITRGQRERTDALGWAFTTLDAALSPRRQAAHIAELIECGVDALTSYTLDAELAEPGYAAAVKAGIQVVTFGAGSPSALTTIRQRVDLPACAADERPISRRACREQRLRNRWSSHSGAGGTDRVIP